MRPSLNDNHYEQYMNQQSLIGPRGKSIDPSPCSAQNTCVSTINRPKQIIIKMGCCQSTGQQCKASYSASKRGVDCSKCFAKNIHEFYQCDNEDHQCILCVTCKDREEKKEKQDEKEAKRRNYYDGSVSIVPNYGNGYINDMDNNNNKLLRRKKRRRTESVELDDVDVDTDHDINDMDTGNNNNKPLRRRKKRRKIENVERRITSNNRQRGRFSDDDQVRKNRINSNNNNSNNKKSRKRKDPPTNNRSPPNKKQRLQSNNYGPTMSKELKIALENDIGPRQKKMVESQFEKYRQKLNESNNKIYLLQKQNKKSDLENIKLKNDNNKMITMSKELKELNKKCQEIESQNAQYILSENKDKKEKQRIVNVFKNEKREWEAIRNDLTKKLEKQMDENNDLKTSNVQYAVHISSMKEYFKNMYWICTAAETI